MLLDDILKSGYARMETGDISAQAIARAPVVSWSNPIPLLFDIQNVLNRCESTDDALGFTRYDLRPPSSLGCFFEAEDRTARDRRMRFGVLAVWEDGVLYLSPFHGGNNYRVLQLHEGIRIFRRTVDMRVIVPRSRSKREYLAVLLSITMLNSPGLFTFEERQQASRAERRSLERAGKPFPFAYRRIILVPRTAEELKKRGEVIEADGLPRRLHFVMRCWVRDYKRRDGTHVTGHLRKEHYRGNRNIGRVDHIYRMKKPLSGPGISQTA